jgi:uncharacterized membrane protein HdeD (DUF308 family)
MDERPDGDGRYRPSAVAKVFPVLGLVLILGGGAALALGVAADRSWEKVTGIVVLVLGLACVRAYRWTRRARLMAQLGRDLHGPDQ